MVLEDLPPRNQLEALRGMGEVLSRISRCQLLAAQVQSVWKVGPKL